MAILITDINDPRVDCFARLTEAQLCNSRECETGLFIAESPKVIDVAINCGYTPQALLCEQKHLDGDAKHIAALLPDDKVYTGSRDTLQALTGYKLTRGVLCAMQRHPLPSVADICSDARLICVIQSVTDTTNIGAIFRSASALGVDAVVLSSDACDPLNRRAVRVSMGTVFTVPWTMCDNPVEELSQLGFETAALALSDNAISLRELGDANHSRLAVVFGTEGDGLPANVIANCDSVVKIPMQHNVDSLNVAAAAAVTFWELTRNRAMD